jgi:predicted chitinase
VDADIKDMLAITKKINGGYNGWKEREQWLKKIEAVQQKGP